MSCVPPNRRSRLATRPFYVVLTVLVVVPLSIGALSSPYSLQPTDLEPMVFQVTRGEFVHEVAARGELESSVNVEVRCEVRSRSNAWTRILEVIPEGTLVQPGDVLIRLDASSLENDRMQQQILVEKAEAWLIDATSKYQIAQAARREYLEGEYTLQSQAAEMALFVAEDKVRRATQTVEFSRQMVARGYITKLQLQADEFALEAAKHEQLKAETRLRILRDYTKVRRLKQLDGAVAAYRASMQSADKIYRIRRDQLAEIESQIDKCTVRAPVAGQVVLAHLHHEGHSHMIEPGELTLQERVLVRLPDPRQMQIRAMINEDKIAQVRAGAPVTICLDAFPDRELRGTVSKVNEYPNPDSWFGPAVKRYETTIRLESSDLPLRPGLTADLKVCVARLDDQLQVPCHAVLEHGEKTYCLSTDGYRLVAQEVVTGPSNGKFTVIKSGLDEGQKVVLGASSYREKVALPEGPGTRSPVAASELSSHISLDLAAAQR
jgi:HlyD family secretion protein